MKNISKYKSLTILVILTIFAFSILLYAYSNGITGVTRKSKEPGCTCHSPSPSTNVIVTINGPDTLTINQTADYSVTISGGPLKAAGTDIAVSSGTLAPVNKDLIKINGELTHLIPKSPSGGVVTFNFTYTAPSTIGMQIIYANGNSVNFNGQNTGDEWNFAPDKIIQVEAISDVVDETNISTYKLEQNYPNPFNPSTKIRYSIPRPEFVSLKVFDLLGEEVATLVNEEKKSGDYEVTFNKNNFSGSTYASGIYIYTLKAGNFSSSKKFILLK